MPALTPGRLSISQIETVLGKSLKDPAFAKALHDDPAAALASIGFPAPHADEIAFFHSLSQGGFSAAATKLHNSDAGHYMTEA